MKAEDLGVIYDEADRNLVESHSWWLNTNGYACTKMRRNGKKVTHLMHRMIFGEVPTGMVVDHINRNPLDNRRCNLRAATAVQNAKNSNNRRGTTSKHRGVSQRRDGKWQVVVRIDGKLKWIGKYDTELEAAAIAEPYFDTPEHQPLKYGVTGA